MQINMDKIFYSSSQSALFKEHKINFILTSRLGGVSKALYHSLNLGYHVGDESKNVLHNRLSIMNEFFHTQKLIYLNQVHSNIIFDTSKQDILSNTEFCLGNGDGLLIRDKNIAGLVMVADCNPILLYSPKQHILAMLHAGRAGVVSNILSNAIDLLESYGASRSDILIFIGASIRCCCYEIKENLAKTFDEKYLNRVDSKITLDLIAMLSDECKANDIKDENIEILPTCTCCEEKLFSYRREGVTGRFGLFATLR